MYEISEIHIAFSRAGIISYFSEQHQNYLAVSRCDHVAPSYIQYKFTLSISCCHFPEKLKLNLKGIL